MTTEAPPSPQQQQHSPSEYFPQSPLANAAPILFSYSLAPLAGLADDDPGALALAKTKIDYRIVLDGDDEEEDAARKPGSPWRRAGLCLVWSLGLAAVACAFAAFIWWGNGFHENDIVTYLPGIGTLPFRALSGFVSVNASTNAELFYFFAESQSNRDEDPVVLWLNGGPGSSSLFGCFVENGPFIIDANGDFSVNQFSWNKQANMLWIDQPVGTGFSHADVLLTTEDEIATQLMTGLIAFFARHPEYSTQKFYIFGESYGGKYVPTLAWYLMNKFPANTTRINLAGIALGNGWVDNIQSASYGPYLFEQGRITQEQLDSTNILAQQYLDFVQNATTPQDWADAFSMDNNLFGNLTEMAKIADVFDIRQASDPTDPPANQLAAWLNHTKVRVQMYTSGRTYSDGVDCYNSLLYDQERSAQGMLESLLNRQPLDVRVLLYVGEYDLVCNSVGVHNMARSLKWPGASRFLNDTMKPWTLNNSTVGSYTAAPGLTELLVHNAGHMSPFDQPRPALALLQSFFSGEF